MPLRYPIRAVTRLTGISMETLRAWERRYQAVMPEHTERGRMYSENEIQRLVLLRGAVDLGHSIGQVAKLPMQDLQEISRRAEHSAPRTPVRLDAPAAIAKLVDAIERYDYVGANEEMGRLASVMPVSTMVHQLTLPLLRVVGERRRCGAMDGAQEHMASSLLRNLMGSLLRLYKPTPPTTPVLLTTPPGEPSDLEILSAAMLAASTGLQAVYLGPNLAEEEILIAADRISARVVILELRDQSAHSPGMHAVRLLAANLPPRVELWLGGHDLEDESAPIRDRVLMLKDFAELEENLARLRGVAAHNAAG